jgi:uncharacterized protein YutE (UPF0331/DUF86 family)
MVAQKKLGLPQNSRDAFSLLEQHGIITPLLSQKMKAMVGFRNIAVHDYQEINLTILQKILDHHLIDLPSSRKRFFFMNSKAGGADGRRPSMLFKQRHNSR